MYQELRNGIRTADHLQKRYPTYTCDVARILFKMLESHYGGERKLSGIYHWQADECLTKYDMMKAIASIMQIDASQIEASKVQPRFPVPPDARLDCSRFEQETGIDPAEYRTPFKEAVGHCLAIYLENEAEGPDSPKTEVSGISFAKSDSDIPGQRASIIPKGEDARVLLAMGASDQCGDHHRCNAK